MLQNAYFHAKIGADTAENEQMLPKICQKFATTLRGRPGHGVEQAREIVVFGPVEEEEPILVLTLFLTFG